MVLGAILWICEFVYQPELCMFACWMFLFGVCSFVLVEPVGEWGEFASNKRSLTHHSRLSRLSTHMEVYTKSFVQRYSIYLSHCGCLFF